ncbi:serine/threonine protein kinase [Dictyobacter vulcani]|nr:serine/threonine-protein kinase [Dictyobacter vulcani]
MQELINITISNYHIDRGLAKGGMSEVYLARDLRTQQIVAMKMVRRSAGEYYERFRREARAMTRLHHPHILSPLDYGEYEHWAYMVTPYIEYGTLSRRAAEGPLPIEEAGEILDQIAGALQFAHEKGMLHRDIKASNVLLRDGHYAYLTDFGLVKSIEDNYSLTRSGFLIGTPEYMAPELVEGAASPASDIYALGVLAYQMVTGSVPFRGPNPVTIVMKHMRDTPQPPSQLNPAVTPDVERVILQTLAKDPARRFRTPKALANAFHQAYQVDALPQPVAGIQSVTPQLPTSINVVPTQQTSTRLPSTGVPRIVWIIGAALLALIILIVLLTHAMASAPTEPAKQPAATTIASPGPGTAINTHTPVATSVTQPTNPQPPAQHQPDAGKGKKGHAKK